MKPEPFKYSHHDAVQKSSGYRWPGIVVSCFRNRNGQARYVVECVVKEVHGALHIFSGAQLKRRRK